MPLKWLWMWTHWRLVRSYINGLSWSFYWLHIIFLKPSMSKLALETGLVFAPLRKLFVTFFIRSLWQLHVIFLEATMGKIICDARFVSGFSFVKKYVVASWRVVVFRLKIKQKITICNVILCINTTQGFFMYLKLNVKGYSKLELIFLELSFYRNI